MPLYSGPYGSTGAGGRTGYYDIGSGGGRVVSLDQGPQSSQPVGDPFHGPGSIDFDITDPSGAIKRAHEESSSVWQGLKVFLFGSDVPDAAGQRGGVLGVGNVPVLGDLGRGVMNVANFPLDLLGGAAGGVADALERIPSPVVSSLQMQPQVEAQVREQFAALPDGEVKQAALDEIAADPGHFLGSKELTVMSRALQRYAQTDPENTDLYAGLLRPQASLADAFDNLFGSMTVPVRAVERLVAGAGRPGTGGMNQLQMILAVGSGQAVWTSDDPGLTPVEQLVYDNVTSGKWTEAQALDFMASHGAGFAHNKALEIAANVGLDPLNVGSVGAAALARLGRTGVALNQMRTEANALLDAEMALGAGADLEKIADLEKAVAAANAGIRAGVRGDSVAARDVLGQIAKQKWAGDVARKFGSAYAAMDDAMVGRIAKIARTVVDPLHAIGGRPKTIASIEEGAQEVTRAVVNAHGEFTNIHTAHHLAEMPGLGRDFVRQYEQGLAIYSGQVLRRVAGRGYRSAQILQGKAEALLNTPVFEGMKGAIENLRKRSLVRVEEEAIKHLKRRWSEADIDNLANRLAVLWGGMTREEWMVELANKRWTPEKMSLLHASTYGTAVRQLHDARQAVIAAGDAGTFADRLHQLVLLNKQTLTDLGAEGILARLAAAPSMDARLAIIEDAKRLYPELRNFVADPTSPSATVNEFIELVERRKNFLPAQIRDAERAGLPAALAEFDDKTRGVFTIGFRPKDEFLWGMERDSNGVLREVGDPWFDQVSDNLQGYMPVREPSFNVSGKPIIGKVLGKTARMIDAAEAAGRVALHGVTGAMVEQAAHSRFVANVTAKYEHSGISASQVEAIWKSLMAKVDDTEDISGVRGLSTGAIWKAARASIPRYAEDAGLDRRALLVHVLEAYNGDLRHIGLTQKFTGKAKLLAGQMTGSNALGQIAEHLWPLLKFRLNVFFQIQEKIEPWILNAQRGASVAIGRKMTETDRLTAQLYRNFIDTNLVNMADNDIAELARKFGWGKGMEAAAQTEGGKMAFFRSKIEGLVEVQGIKQLNMMRTFRKGLGREMKQVWEQNLPGEWDKMLTHARAMAGSLIDEDEFAVRLAAENLDANRIMVRRMAGVGGGLTGYEAEFANAIKVGQWSAPQSLGELRALDLDHVVDRLRPRDTLGTELTTSMEVRAALADQRLNLEDILRGLRELNAHPDYVRRVESAFNFSWRQFWQDVQDSFSLTGDERARFESLFAAIAQNRGMTPVEYMSQVYSPVISQGGTHAVGSLGALVDFARGGRTVTMPDLASLSTRGGSTADDLYRQMGAVMAHHLDPSAKRAFLLEINPSLRQQAMNGDILTGLDEIEAMWTSEATDALSDRIMRFAQGQPGSGAHLPADEAGGVARIRDGAMRYRDQAGRPRNLQRVVYEDNPALAKAVADAYEEMPERFSEVPTLARLDERVDVSTLGQIARGAPSATAYRVGYRGLPKTLQSSYDAFARESRQLYAYLTDELGVTVTTGRPYSTPAAMRNDLARGRLRIPASGYFHPVYNIEDLAIQRAVRDAFGYGQEANAFGSHDAIFSAAGMYTDEARAVMLSDEFARTSWEGHSANVIPQPVPEPTNVAEYEARWGYMLPDDAQMEAGGPFGLSATRPQQRNVGMGIRALPEDQQTELITHLGQLRNQFPGVELAAIDVAPLGDGIGGAMMGFGGEQPTIVLSSDMWNGDEALRQANLLDRQMHSQAYRDGHNPVRYGTLPGRPVTISDDGLGDLYHEFGHIVELQITRADDVDIIDFMDRLVGTRAAKALSEYANSQRGELFPELFDLAFNPSQSEFLLGSEIAPELQNAVNIFRKMLRDKGHWKPDGVPAPVVPHAGKTIAEANAAGAGIRAEHRIGLLPQELLDQLTENFLGSGRFAEANPDVARMAAYFNEWTHTMTQHVLREGEAGDINRIFAELSGMPVNEPSPFNLTEARLWDAAVQSMATKWEDAFRLQYFAQNRSMFQRSLNHPMFGLYPASYMWGKVGPELIKFLALEPFGVNTGAMLWTLADFQKAIAVQRTYDPEFDAFIEQLGTNPALSFLGYMLPATPWSVPASYPSWLRDMAQQGLENQQRAASGGLIEENNWITPLSSVVKRTVPYTTTIPWLARAGVATSGALSDDESLLPQPASMQQDAFGNIVAAPDLSQPTQATDLGGVLDEQMRNLQALLGR